jgi:hypothetical protein
MWQDRDVGNSITADHSPTLPPLNMSNGLTDVFLSVLALAGAPVAHHDDEVELLVWLAAHDQAVFGLGCVGFDVCQMPWIATRLDEQKRFLLGVIDAGIARARAASHEALLDRFHVFRGYVDKVHASCLRNDAYPNVTPLLRADRATCPTHGVYLHAEGCIVCNDGELTPAPIGSKSGYFV